MSLPISTGNIRRYLHACACGRTFELDTPNGDLPAHTHNHRLSTDGAEHACTGCTWHVTTYTPATERAATMTKVTEAFVKHHNDPARLE